MLQNLLTERFHLSLHHEKRRLQVYSLTLAKGGARLKPAATSWDSNPAARFTKDEDETGITRLSFRGSTLDELKFRMGMALGDETANGAVRRIEDRTGLNGRYDFELAFAGHLGPGGAFPENTLTGGDDDRQTLSPNLFETLEKQLGLKLALINTPFDVIVVDHADKVPTGN